MRIDIEILLKELERLSFVELLELYIEAITGATEVVENFPEETKDLIDKLNNILHHPETYDEMF